MKLIALEPCDFGLAVPTERRRDGAPRPAEGRFEEGSVALPYTDGNNHRVDPLGPGAARKD